MSSAGAVPLLREDLASIDWLSATYQAEIKISGRVAISTNKLVGAPQLDALIAAGHVQWAIEVRCPKTLYARVAYSVSANVRSEWNPDDVDGEMFLTSGLVAVRDCQLPTDGLNDLWGNDPIGVKAGRWLARGMILRTQSLASSLLEFHKNTGLSEGEMRVEPDTGSGDLRFKVYLAPGYFDQVIQTNRDVQIAALIAAFGRIPHIDSGDERGGYAVLTQIKAALQEAEVPIWGPELNADFDPARAATAIERFRIPASGEDQ